MIICFDFQRGKFLRLIVYSSICFSVEETIPCDPWPWIQWLMPSPQLHLLWVIEMVFSRLLWPSQVHCPACCLCRSPCMSATKAKTLWSLTSCLPTSVRVIVMFSWANSVMYATESGALWSSFLWSSAQWSIREIVKGADHFRSHNWPPHSTQRQPQQTRSAVTYLTTYIEKPVLYVFNFTKDNWWAVQRYLIGII
jgi:hypothetical protein